MIHKTKKVFVGMSGGVDSSVAAYLLEKQGYDVTGVFLRSYNLDGCAERDAEDARRVAEQIGIPFYVFDCEKEYKDKVVDYMVKGYAAGETPNPDVMCNKEIKFGLFYDKALTMGADYVATGHYVILRRNSLFEARDKNKDQSYFLWTLTQVQLAHCLFPIGKYTKPEVREIARKAGLPTAEKKDSQGICFLGQVSLEDFLKDYIKPMPGEVLTVDGHRIGDHAGAAFYTIGQRHGLNLGMTNKELGIRGAKTTKPYYVAEKDIATNTVVVAEGDDNPALFRKEVKLADVNFISPKTDATLRANKNMNVMARVRYRQPLTEAILSYGADFLSIKFSQPVKFVAKGQSAVFYSKEGEMLGGGVIC